MNFSPKYLRLGWMASLSSLILVLASVVVVNIEDGDGPVIVSQIVVAVALILFGALVLVPHVQAQKRQAIRLIGIACLPFLIILLSILAVMAMNYGLEVILDRYVPIAAENMVVAFASGASVVVLGNGFIWMANLRRSEHFWRNVSLLAVVVAALIFVFLESFCILGCSKWDDRLAVLSGVLLFFGTPLGLTTALYFGIADAQ